MAAKFIPFEEVEQLADILRLAQMLNLDLKRSGSQMRCACPVHGGDHRTLCISPEVRSKRGSLGVWYCQNDKTGGDRIGLVAHCMEMTQQDAAFFIASQFGMEVANSKGTSAVEQSTVRKERATAPPAQAEGATKREPTRSEFDPLAFLAKLEFTKEVEATGLSEEDAKSLGVGFYRGKLYIAMRWPNGEISGYAAVDGAKLPKTLVSQTEAKVLRFDRQRA